MKTRNLRISRLGGILLLLIAPPLMGTTWIGVPLEEAADVIVILVPTNDHALHIPAPVERSIKGQILRLEKGRFEKGPMPEPIIVQTPNSFTAPLKGGVPRKLYLNKFPDRNAYYLIGSDPVKSGGRI